MFTRKECFKTFDEGISNRNILKFVNKQKLTRGEGIKCFPEQLFGVSEESPQHFRNPKTLIAKASCSPCLLNAKNKQSDYLSQKQFIHVSPEMEDRNNDFMSSYTNKVKKDKKAFHLRKGAMSEFLDRNVWMPKHTKIMGKERDDEGRKFSNKDRQSLLEARKESFVDRRNSFQSVRERVKSDPNRGNMIQVLMGEKSKIRKMRNQLASAQNETEDRPVANTSSVRSMSCTQKRAKLSKKSEGDSSHIISSEWMKKDQAKVKESFFEDWQDSTGLAKLTKVSSMFRKHKKQMSIKI